MNRKKWISLMGLMLALGVISCDEKRMCDDDASCYSVCAMYEKSVMMFACSAEGSCICLDSEELACDAAEVVEEGEIPHCEKVCAAVKPGSQGVCKKSMCECQDADEESGSNEENGGSNEENGGSEEASSP